MRNKYSPLGRHHIDDENCSKPATSQRFTPLALEERPTVDTAAAAHYLHLAQQTMRIYACKENGPIRPLRINGRLHWATADIRKLLGVA
jgi:hypothetical protein